MPSARGAAIAPPNISPWASATDPVYAGYVNALSVASGRCSPRLPGTPFALLPFSGACPTIVTGFIRNIGEKAVYTATARSFSVVGLKSASIAPPRTWGGRLDFPF